MALKSYEAPVLEVVDLEAIYADGNGKGNHYGWKSGFIAPGQDKDKSDKGNGNNKGLDEGDNYGFDGGSGDGLAEGDHVGGGDAPAGDIGGGADLGGGDVGDLGGDTGGDSLPPSESGE